MFNKTLKYLNRSGINQVRFLGGEPTLHPDFMKYVQIALNSKFKIMLFTNGIVTDKILRFLDKIDNDKINILLNSICPDENNTKGLVQQKKFMQILRQKVTLGVTLYKAGQQINYLIENIYSYRLNKQIRVGISHRALGKQNSYLHPKEYYKIGNQIAQFKKELINLNISLRFDCGFVPCMFSPETLNLFSEELNRYSSNCNPIIDILGNGTVISCYPLGTDIQFQLDNKHSRMEYVKKFEQTYSMYKDIGIYNYCSSCPLFRIKCSGGCLSYKVQRFKIQ
jgi:MoaA/NifB/PqqE/SkfB family radical SAM enzyme